MLGYGKKIYIYTVLDEISVLRRREVCIMGNL